MSHGKQNSLALNLDDLVALAVRLGYDCDLSEKDIETLESRCAREGIKFLTVELPSIAKALCKGVTDGYLTLPQGFGPRRKGSPIPAFLSDLFLDIFHIDGTYKDCDTDTRSFRSIYQFCTFFYKMEFPFTISQQKTFTAQFINTDAEVRCEPYVSQDPILDLATQTITDVFEDFNPDELICADGPGVTSNCTFLSKRTKRIAAFDSTKPQYLSHFFLNFEAYLDEAARWPDYEDSQIPVTKVIFVPKDSRGPRVISAEPRENQYLQQGIRRYMYTAIERSPLTAGQINFTDQTFNQRAALEASSTRRLATIDLKEASDRVSLSLVRRLFSGVPLLRQYMLDSRSPMAELPDGKKMFLSKFAPMGSALCFPVMALVIYALSRAAMDLRDSSLDEVLCVSPNKSVLVYGDDIIVDADYSYLVMDVLETYGLKVNTSKSYIGSPFAESCGQDAYKGCDVTPVRLRVSLDTLIGPLKLPNGKNRFRPLNTDGLSMIETVNLLDQKGRPNAARFLLKKLEHTFGCFPIAHPFSGYPCLHKHGELSEEIMGEGNPRKPRYWSVKSVAAINPAETGWTHLLRTIHSLGTNAEAPEFGENSIPKQLKIEPRSRPRFDSYDYPASNWLPSQVAVGKGRRELDAQTLMLEEAARASEQPEPTAAV